MEQAEVTKQTEINRQYYPNKKERIKNGICRVANCGLPRHISKNGKKFTSCFSHRDKDILRHKKKREEQIKNGICKVINCKQLVLNKNERKTNVMIPTRCAIHRNEVNQKERERCEEKIKKGVCLIAICESPIYISKNGKKTRYCINHKKEANQRERERCEEKIKKGICIIANCELSIHISENGKKIQYCTSHRDAASQKREKRVKERRSAGTCNKCDSPVYVSNVVSAFSNRKYANKLSVCERHWRMRHTLKVRFHNGKYKTRLRNLEWITFDEYVALNPIQCHYCMEPIIETSGHGLDRKNSTIRAYRDNCVPCCWECNRSKGSDISYEEMLVLAEFRKRKKEDQDLIINKILTQRKTS